MTNSEDLPDAWFGDPRTRRRVWLAATAILAVAIAILTLAPTVPMPRGHDHWDKVAHLVAFLSLVFPTALLWPRATGWVAVFAVAYGGAIEVIQPYTGRSAEFADLLADGAGVMLGIVAGVMLRRMLRARFPLGAR